MTGAGKASAGPTLIIVAGPNGSGKTTLTDALRQRGIDLGRYINPDEISATLTGSQFDRDRRAQKMALAERRKAIEEGASVAYETVMSHPSHLDLMQQALGLGYRVCFYFVGVGDPKINLDRVAHRVALGGHDVPAEKVLSRYIRVMRHLSAAVLCATKSIVFDNSRPGGPPRAIVEVEGGQLTVLKDEIPEWVKVNLLEPLFKDGRIAIVAGPQVSDSTIAWISEL